MRSAEYTQRLTEAQFQEKVIDLAKARDWLVHHVRPARTEKGWRTPIQGHVGFPDLVLARPGEAMFVELKSETGRLTAQQKRWIEVLEAAGEVVRVWRPSDWPEIERMLS